MPIEKTIFIPKVNEEVHFVIGKNAKENFEIIDHSKPNDLWFHIENAPSCHVIAKINDSWDRKQIASVVKQGALLCKINSKFASVQNVPVIYTKVQHVEKTKIIGSVIVHNEKNTII